MYEFLLPAHSWNRWIVAALLSAVLIKSLIGFLSGGRYEKLDNALGGALIGFTHLQLLMGLILYFISPITKAAMADMGAAMKDPALRFYAVEHFTMMFLMVGLIQAGRTLSKRRDTDKGKFQVLLITGLLAVVCLIFGVKWA